MGLVFFIKLKKVTTQVRKDASSKPTLGAALSSSSTAVSPMKKELIKKGSRKLTSRRMKPKSNSISDINKGRIQGGAAAAAVR